MNAHLEIRIIDVWIPSSDQLRQTRKKEWLAFHCSRQALFRSHQVRPSWLGSACAASSWRSFAASGRSGTCSCSRSCGARALSKAIPNPMIDADHDLPSSTPTSPQHSRHDLRDHHRVLGHGHLRFFTFVIFWIFPTQVLTPEPVDLQGRAEWQVDVPTLLSRHRPNHDTIDRPLLRAVRLQVLVLLVRPLPERWHRGCARLRCAT